MITKERVEEILGKIRTGLKSEGGDIELINHMFDLKVKTLVGTTSGFLYKKG